MRGRRRCEDDDDDTDDDDDDDDTDDDTDDTPMAHGRGNGETHGTPPPPPTTNKTNKTNKTNVKRRRVVSAMAQHIKARLMTKMAAGVRAKQALYGEGASARATRGDARDDDKDLTYVSTYDLNIDVVDAANEARSDEERARRRKLDVGGDETATTTHAGRRPDDDDDGARATKSQLGEFIHEPAAVRTPVMMENDVHVFGSPSSRATTTTTTTTSEEDVDTTRASASSQGGGSTKPTTSNKQGKLCELRTQERASKTNTSTLPTVYAIVNQGVVPEDLLQGKDADQWRAFVDQGAMVLRLPDGWDVLEDVSALCDLNWIGKRGLKLRTLGPDYQYLRQSLPDSKTGLLPRFTAMDGYDYDMELGAFIDDFQENVRAHADHFRLMGVDARESWFLHQVHTGFPLQFPYLQGLAYKALIANVSAKVLTAQWDESHAWDPRLLGERSPSILRRCLQLCESVNHSVIAEARAAAPPDRGAIALAAREEEMRATGGSAILANSDAVRRRIERKCILGKSGGINAGKKKGKQKSKNPVKDSPPPQPVVADASAYISKASERRLWGVGIVTPWLYYMGVGSIFPLHFEDYAFGSANVILARPDSQAWVVWYSIPRADLYLLHVYLRELLGDAYTLDVLEMRKLWLDPVRIEQWNAKRKKSEDKLRVYRHVQKPGDYVVTDYGSVHWGVNLGAGWKAAVNFAYLGWKPAAEEVNEVYRQLESELGQSRHHRCCPKFHEVGDRFSEANIVAPDTKER